MGSYCCHENKESKLDGHNFETGEAPADMNNNLKRIHESTRLGRGKDALLIDPKEIFKQ